MTSPVISIIVPVYNGAKYLHMCIDSVIQQTYCHWQLILINDNSTDDSESIILHYVTQYPNQIKVVHNYSNLGPGLSRNAGIEIATGQWLFFLDADDFLKSQCLEHLINATSNCNYDVLIANYYSFKDNILKINPCDLVSMMKNSRYALSMYAWGTLYNMVFWKSNNFLFENNYAEDLLLISRVLSCTNKIYVTNLPLYVYRSNQQSLTHTVHPYAVIKDTLLKLLIFIKDDETEAFVLSNSYNLIKIVAFPYHRWKLFQLVKQSIPIYPQYNSFANQPIISLYKRKKLHKLYATNGWYFFWHVDILGCYKFLNQRMGLVK